MMLVKQVEQAHTAAAANADSGGACEMLRQPPLLLIVSVLQVLRHLAGQIRHSTGSPHVHVDDVVSGGLEVGRRVEGLRDDDIVCLAISGGDILIADPEESA